MDAGRLPSSSHTKHYAFHGVGLAVSANDSAIAAALHTRLRHFVQRGPVADPLTFDLVRLSEGQPPAIGRPAGPGRPVYDESFGDICYFADEDQLYLDRGDCLRALCDPPRGRTSISIDSGFANIRAVSHAAFTLSLFELLKRRGKYHLHAGCLAIGTRGIVLAGTTGAGKSTLTLALLRAGFDYLGDDTVFLERRGDGLRILAFPEEVDATSETISLFPELRRVLPPVAEGNTKRQICPETVYAAGIAPECRPAVLVFPRVGPSPRSRIWPIERDEALLDLMPNVLLTERVSSQAHLDVLGDLVRTTPCFRLETGRDFGELPAILREVLDAASRPGPQPHPASERP